MLISVVIPNYNGFEIIKKNIPVVLKVISDHHQKNGDEFQVIIVDDGSTDESVAYLNEVATQSKKELEIEIIQNDKNYGFATTVNRGVEVAKGEIVLLLNTDIVPDAGFLQPLLKHFTEDKVFAVGCMDRSIENSHEVMRGRGIGRWEKGFLKHKLGHIDSPDTLWVSGGSGAFRRKVWLRLDGLNELMNPFYWEDIDLSYRAQKAGFTVLFEKESIVTHRHEEGAIKKEYTPKKVRVTAYRNQFIFAWTNMSDKTLILSHILWQPYHIVRSVIKGDASFLTGFFNALVLLPAIMRKRKDVQKDVVVSDKIVIRRLTRN